MHVKPDPKRSAAVRFALLCLALNTQWPTQ